MAKRKSENGIVLKTGESQLADGRFRYRYYDDVGKAHDIYSWRLRAEDPVPEGKRYGASLREQEAEIKRQLEDGLRIWEASGLTVEKLCREYMEEQKPFWKPNSYTTYELQFKNYIVPLLGKKKVAKVTTADMENYFLSLVNDYEMKASSAEISSKLLNSAFKTAVKRRIIQVNPCSGALGAVKKKTGFVKEQKHALEAEELNILLECIRNQSPEKYIPVYILAWSGLRIGELAGLCWCDVDFESELIRVRRTAEYSKIDGKTQHYFNTPKTAAGEREIPMLKDVKKLLLQVRKESKIIKIVPPEKVSVDDVIFKKRNGDPLDSVAMQNFFESVVTRYNKSHNDKLPHVTPHIFRHTFTCWLIENFSCGEHASLLDNLKYVQRILGHTDASTTLNVYSELRKDKLAEKHELLKQKAMNE